MDAKKVLKTTRGVVLYSVGVAAALIKYDLHVADVVVCGFLEVKNQIVGGSDGKAVKEIFGDFQKGIGTSGKYLMKKGKELID